MKNQKECASNDEQGFNLYVLTGEQQAVNKSSFDSRTPEDTAYLKNKGVDVMAFDDFYPEGHQSGVSIIMHGNRVATNGDIRFNKTPGQWHPIPKQGERKFDVKENTITTRLSFPDSLKHLDFQCDYNVVVKGEGDLIIVTVNMENPIPEDFSSLVCFNLELFPGALFGKPWIMDGKQGIFPTQPNGPVLLDDFVPEPYAVGKRLTVQPDDPYSRITIETKDSIIKLYDGRMNHHNGWFIVSGEVPVGVTEKAIQWIITPNVVKDWIYKPVIQVSQVGYHPNQTKIAIIELDKRETKREKLIVYKITETGAKEIFSAAGHEWGQFLRYNYLKFSFTNVKEEGLYKICYGSSESPIFRIAHDVYDRGVWQPVLEYFLPVQMCHMRVNEKSRAWHGLCHMDDAQMAPVNHLHFDGYEQGASTLTKYKPGDVVPGLNIGGWHDAGDDDLRVESQATEIYILSLAYEMFNVNYDTTTIDQNTRTVEIHQPDGKNDILQQIEHGVLSVVGAYRSLGRLYRGIIVNSIKQYVLLGDPSLQTDNIMGNTDDRWVFTEDNPPRELTTAAHLAAASRALKGFNDKLSEEALQAACEIYEVTDIERDADIYKTEHWYKFKGGKKHAKSAKIHAAAELFLTTGEQKYKDYLLAETGFITDSIITTGWFIGRAEKAINDPAFSQAILNAMPALKKSLADDSAETPYGIPYRPHIWGAGWGIQQLGFKYYFLHKAYPDIFDPEMIYNALNFVLGCHPGSNNMSFASGIGAKSATIAYGWNRADWSFVPGGVISGTALIRPDFPELLEFPYLWQQTEYVMGGGSSHYMFLVLATQQILQELNSREG